MDKEFQEPEVHILSLQANDVISGSTEKLEVWELPKI